MKYWLSTLGQDVSLQRMVSEAKMRWCIERDHHDLKQEVGPGARRRQRVAWLASSRQLENRRLRIFDATTNFGTPTGSVKKTLHDAENLSYPRITSLAAAHHTQRHVPSSITTLRLRIAAALLKTLPRCSCCLRTNARLNL